MMLASYYVKTEGICCDSFILSIRMVWFILVWMDGVTSDVSARRCSHASRQFLLFFAECTSWFVQGPCFWNSRKISYVVAESHWIVQLFIQAKQKTSHSPLFINIDVTTSVYLWQKIFIGINSKNYTVNNERVVSQLTALLLQYFNLEFPGPRKWTVQNAHLEDILSIRAPLLLWIYWYLTWSLYIKCAIVSVRK